MPSVPPQARTTAGASAALSCAKPPPTKFQRIQPAALARHTARTHPAFARCERAPSPAHRAHHARHAHHAHHARQAHPPDARSPPPAPSVTLNNGLAMPKLAFAANVWPAPTCRCSTASRGRLRCAPRRAERRAKVGGPRGLPVHGGGRDGAGCQVVPARRRRDLRHPALRGVVRARRSCCCGWWRALRQWSLIQRGLYTSAPLRGTGS